MEDERRKHSLTREDLSSLMESYKNTIESNLMLTEKMDLILNKIVDACNIFSDVKEMTSDNFKIITDHHSECKHQQRVYNSELLRDISDKHTDDMRSDTSLNIKIYGIIGVLMTIIIGLIGLVFKMAEKIPHHVP
jgi:hypothetical protein